jgi:long-chain acyl-CoA synthetase
MMITESVCRNAALHPEKTAVVFGDRRLTWRQFHERSNRVANRLAKLRISNRAYVAVVSPNCLEYPEIMVGALKAGTVFVSLSIDLSPDVAVKELQKADAKAIFAGHSVIPLVSGFRKLCTKIVVGGREEGWLTYEGFLQAGMDSEPAYIPSAIDPCGGYASQDRLTAAETFCRKFAVSTDSISLIGAPLSEEGAQRLCLPTILAGGTLIIMGSFDPVDFSELVRRERCTHAALNPVQIAAIMPNFRKNEITLV